MENNFKRISDELKLPEESRGRIRSLLASHKNREEENNVKKIKLSHATLIAAAVAAALVLTLTAAAAVGQMFRNDVIVSDKEDIPLVQNVGSDSGYSFISPSGRAPSPLEEMIESSRFKSGSWTTGDSIGGGVVAEYTQWDDFEVLSDDPALRSRRVTREDGAEKMEYTAQDPTDLLQTLTGRVTFDPEWLNEHYDYVPDGNFSFVVTDGNGEYVSELFSALYAKPDESGYFTLDLYDTAQEDYFQQSYIIDGSFETAYYYTAAGGYEFLIEADNGRVWAECGTSHVYIHLYGAYLTTEEVEALLDNLYLTEG